MSLTIICHIPAFVSLIKQNAKISFPCAHLIVVEPKKGVNKYNILSLENISKLNAIFLKYYSYKAPKNWESDSENPKIKIRNFKILRLINL